MHFPSIPQHSLAFLSIPQHSLAFLSIPYFCKGKSSKIVSKTSQKALLVGLLFKTGFYLRASYNSKNTVHSSKAPLLYRDHSISIAQHYHCLTLALPNMDQNFFVFQGVKLLSNKTQSQTQLLVIAISFFSNFEPQFQHCLLAVTILKCEVFQHLSVLERFLD